MEWALSLTFVIWALFLCRVTWNSIQRSAHVLKFLGITIERKADPARFWLVIAILIVGILFFFVAAATGIASRLASEESDPQSTLDLPSSMLSERDSRSIELGLQKDTVGQKMQ